MQELNEVHGLSSQVLLVSAGVRLHHVFLIRDAVLLGLLPAVPVPFLLRLHKRLGVPLLQLWHSVRARKALSLAQSVEPGLA